MGYKPGHQGLQPQIEKLRFFINILTYNYIKFVREDLLQKKKKITLLNKNSTHKPVRITEQKCQDACIISHRHDNIWRR